MSGHFCDDRDCSSLPTHYVRRDGTWTGPCYWCKRPTTMEAADFDDLRLDSQRWMWRRPRGTSRQRAATSRSRMQDDRRMANRERSYVEFVTYDGPDSKPPPWAVWRNPWDGTRYA